MRTARLELSATGYMKQLKVNYKTKNDVENNC